MARTRPPLAIDLSAVPRGLPMFQRIAEAIAREIRRGRIAPGQQLPSSRGLAETLGVHRNTVLAAYEELDRQGYIETRPARGTFVTEALPERVPARSGPSRTEPLRLRLPEAPTLSPVLERGPGCFALVGGQPDLRHVPTGALARAYRAALRSSATTLDYGDERGQPRLRAALLRFLRDTRGVVAAPDEILVTRGSQQALYLAAKSVVRPGAAVAVERYGYRPAWEAFRLAGAELVPVGVDDEGLVVADLAELVQRREVAAIYTTPHHQYPTTVTMSAARRMQLLRLAQDHRCCILEDDYDHEFHFEGRPVLPLASADACRVVVHIGTLSKVFAPGMRLGYAVAQPEIVARMAAHRRFIDRQGDHALELAFAHLLEDGEVDAHIRRMHRIYGERRTLFHGMLRERLAGALSFTPPPGGLALWARITCGVKPERWVEHARALSLSLDAASRFRFDGRSAPFMRLGFAPHDPCELATAVERLARSLDRALEAGART